MKTCVGFQLRENQLVTYEYNEKFDYHYQKLLQYE